MAQGAVEIETQAANRLALIRVHRLCLPDDSTEAPVVRCQSVEVIRLAIGEQSNPCVIDSKGRGDRIRLVSASGSGMNSASYRLEHLQVKWVRFTVEDASKSKKRADSMSMEMAPMP
jgi:hypothetical protein